MGRHVNNKLRKQVLDLYAKGLTPTQVGKLLGITRQHADYLKKTAGQYSLDE